MDKNIASVVNLLSVPSLSVMNMLVLEMLVFSDVKFPTTETMTTTRQMTSLVAIVAGIMSLIELQMHIQM
jgi:hypothetical protein